MIVLAPEVLNFVVKIFWPFPPPELGVPPMAVHWKFPVPPVEVKVKFWLGKAGLGLLEEGSQVKTGWDVTESAPTADEVLYDAVILIPLVGDWPVTKPFEVVLLTVAFWVLLDDQLAESVTS